MTNGKLKEAGRRDEKSQREKRRRKKERRKRKIFGNVAEKSVYLYTDIQGVHTIYTGCSVTSIK